MHARRPGGLCRGNGRIAYDSNADGDFDVYTVGASGAAIMCGKQQVTVLGTQGSEKLVGTRGDDIVCSGKDVLDAAARTKTACGVSGFSGPLARVKPDTRRISGGEGR